MTKGKWKNGEYSNLMNVFLEFVSTVAKLRKFSKNSLNHKMQPVDALEPRIAHLSRYNVRLLFNVRDDKYVRSARSPGILPQRFSTHVSTGSSSAGRKTPKNTIHMRVDLDTRLSVVNARCLLPSGSSPRIERTDVKIPNDVNRPNMIHTI